MGAKCPTQEGEVTRICHHIFLSLTYPGDPKSRRATAGESCRQMEGAQHHLAWEAPFFTLLPREDVLGH